MNAGVSVYSITTDGTIGHGATVHADGSVGVTADEALQLDVVAGNIAVGGAAGVGVAASVPVITKNTQRDDRRLCERHGRRERRRRHGERRLVHGDGPGHALQRR